MKKYNIEGNVDFFSELYKSLDEDDNNDKESDNNICLITNQILIDNFVELNCGHKFNYIPLYNDIYNHKKKFNNLEGSATSLKMNEIRCPYCRKKQSGVLPYYANLISEKIDGVNFYDNTKVQDKVCNSNNGYTFGKCEFIIPTPNTPTLCPITYVTKLECDNKSYCWTHNKIMIKKYEKEKKEKEKEAQKKLIKEAKQKEKEEKKAEKEALKKTIKKNKDLILSITDVEDENIVVSINPEIQSINEGCTQIIKTGTNKGNQCGLAVLNDCLCKRHYNLKNKSNNVNI